MAKFQKSNPPAATPGPVSTLPPYAPAAPAPLHPSLLAGKPLPENLHTPSLDAAAPATEPVFIAHNNAAMAKQVGDILSDEDKKGDPDKPANRDYDYADHTNRIGGTRQFMSDPLTRQLNCTMYILDVAKTWGRNPLGGRPAEVMYTREFPEIKVLYDSFGLSPETAKPEVVAKMIEMKRQMAHEHGFRYLFQSQWKTLTTDQLTIQLAAEDAWLKEWKAKQPK